MAQSESQEPSPVLPSLQPQLQCYNIQQRLQNVQVMFHSYNGVQCNAGPRLVKSAHNQAVLAATHREVQHPSEGPESPPAQPEAPQQPCLLACWI